VLRTIVFVFGAGLVALGIFLYLSGVKYPGVQTMIFGAVLALAVLVERWRYHNAQASRAGNWAATGERFVDPQSGQNMEVQYDARTGERRYVPLEERHDKPG
jgi:hypothetical protein